MPLYLTRCRAESKKVFVGGLLAEVTEKEFADYFGAFGLVKVWLTIDNCDRSHPVSICLRVVQLPLTIGITFQDVAIMVDRATNKSRGFGFVTFETEEAVEAVMRNKVG